MFINSNFNDYYDFVQKNGQDPAIVYNRKEDHIELRTLDKETIAKLEAIFILQRRLNCIGKRRIGDPGYEVFVIAGRLFAVRPDGVQIDDVEAELKFHNIRERNDYIWIRPKYKNVTTKLLEDICSDLGAPIFCFRRNFVIINPNLKARGYKPNAFDVYSLIFNFFQSAEPEMVPANDKTKMQSHGFDNHSFKREAGGPTRKRKKLISTL